MDAQNERRDLYLAYSRFLSLDPPARQRDLLHDLAASIEEKTAVDFYGTSGQLEAFERRIAELLGKPAAVFGPSGKMLQNAALRVWADRAGCRKVALHPQSHIVIDEADAYREVFGLEGLWLCPEGRLPAPEDLKAIESPLGAVALELPLRNIGCRLPAWDDLRAFAGLCRERQVALHADAARIWESQPSTGARSRRSPALSIRSMCRSTRASAAWRARRWPARKTSSRRCASGSGAAAAVSSACSPTSHRR